MNEEQKKYYQETERSLFSADTKIVRARVAELKKTGNTQLFPLLLALLKSDPEEEVKQEIIDLLNNLRDQKCVPLIVDFINNNQQSEALTDVLSSCWQSRLDFSKYLHTFTDCFVRSNYRNALESFTVIEEMIWKIPENDLQLCHSELMGRIEEVDELKKPLFHELLALLKSGRTQNQEDYPGLYPE